ncbi:MAG: VWA domain-containing protein [Treponema sp.]|nr:VWA domain-containing protein [Treponema sp.]
MFDFQNPAAFLLLLLIPLLYFLRWLKVFSRISFPAVLSDWNGKSFEWKGNGRKIFAIIARIFALSSFVLVVCAFASPVISKQEKVFTSLGADIVFVLDTSPSMAAKDVDNNTRINAAKESIKAIAGENKGFRYGIVVFGSEASVLIPPTNDEVIFSQRLNDCQIGLLGDGSAIGDGLSTAVCHLLSSSAPKKYIILLTDGENNAGTIHPNTAVSLAKDNDIAIYVVGIGTKGTVPIEYTNVTTGKQYMGYLDSNFNSESLKNIATEAKGRYFEARTIQELNNTLKLVTKNEVIVQNFTYKIITELYYDKFLFFALIFIVAAWFIKRIILGEIV